MLAIRRLQWSLKATFLESFHPNRKAIDVPVHNLDSISTMIEEDKQSTRADIAIEVSLDDTEESIKALSHIDRLGVQEDLYLSAECKHLRDLLQNALERVDCFDGY